MAGPRLIKREVIPRKPLPQLVSDPNPNVKILRRAGQASPTTWLETLWVKGLECHTIGITLNNHF
jgi:hypothetical protein